ncbi:MAG TPA: N-acetylmuramoyl-L-alanine amidase [Castellaniella sp.]|uniref:N-acetylmuramoyl-L-alanine amidase family protein n=1 Tax=Castellaniella sp. TaxID=1955812 RepID=UPI002EE33BC5
MRHGIWVASACIWLAGCSAPAGIATPTQPVQTRPVQPLIVLDPGHNPSDGGATSVLGTREVGYNDRFVAELAPALQQAGWQVKITRQPEESMSLIGRAQVANELRATVFLSVHHDSVQLRCLRQVQQNGRVAFQTLKPTSGYSLYVSKENGNFARSLQLATDLGEQLRALGRAPMLEHAGKTCGEGRPLLNPGLGIYRYDHLAVLRHNQVPAVLLEVGVITDVQDEAYVDVAANRKKMIAAIVRAMGEFLHS